MPRPSIDDTWFGPKPPLVAGLEEPLPNSNSGSRSASWNEDAASAAIPTTGARMHVMSHRIWAGEMRIEEKKIIAIVSVIGPLMLKLSVALASSQEAELTVRKAEGTRRAR